MATETQTMQAIVAARAIYSATDAPSEYGIAVKVAEMVFHRRARSGATITARDALRKAIELDLVMWRDSRSTGRDLIAEKAQVMAVIDANRAAYPEGR